MIVATKFGASLAMWAISTGLYWLTKRDAQDKPKPELLVKPTSKEAQPFPIVFGCGTVTPILLKFSEGVIYDGVQRYRICLGVCMGNIQGYIGSYVGGKRVHYGCPINAPSNPLSDSIFYFPFRLNAEGSIDIPNNPSPQEENGMIKFFISDVKAGTDANFFQYLYMGGRVNNFSAEWKGNNYRGAFLRTGYEPNGGYEYHPDFESAWFDKDIYRQTEGRPDLPVYRNMTLIFMNEAFAGDLPSITCKIQRYNRRINGKRWVGEPDLDGKDWREDLTETYYQRNVVRKEFYPESYWDEIELRNSAFSIRGINPAHVILDVLTSPLLPMKLPFSSIDYDSWLEMAEVLYTEKFGLNIPIDANIMSSLEFIQQILTYIDGFVYKSSDTGKVYFKLIRPDQYDPDSLPILDESIIEDIEDYTSYIDGDETPNTITISYVDRFSVQEGTYPVRFDYFPHDTQKSITVRDDADASERGVVEEKLDMPWVSDAGIARSIAERRLFMNSAKVRRLKIKGNYLLNKRNSGDVVKVSWSKLNMSEAIFRIYVKDISELQHGSVTLTAVEDIYGVGFNSYVPPEPEIDLPPFESVFWAQSSLFEILLKIGESSYNPGDNTAPNSQFLIPANSKQDRFAVYYRPYNPPQEFVLDTDMNPLVPKDTLYVLLKNIDTYDNELPVDEYFENMPDNTIFFLRNEANSGEMMKVENRLIHRACFDTSLSFYSEGDYAFVIFTQDPTIYTNQMIFFKTVIDEMELKTIAINAQGETPIEDAQSITLTPAPKPRYMQPLNMTGITIAGVLWSYNEDYPIGVADDQDVEIYWKNKSRFLASPVDSKGIRSIYDRSDDYNILETDVYYEFQFFEGYTLKRTETVPFTSIDPTSLNTKFTYSMDDFRADCPSGICRLRIVAWRPSGTGSDYYSVPREVYFKRVAVDIEKPYAIFCFTKEAEDGTQDRKAWLYRNIFYPYWYGSEPSLKSTWSLDFNYPEDPATSSVTDSTWNGVSIPTDGGNFSYSELVEKDWWTRLRPYIGASWLDDNLCDQSLFRAKHFLPPVIRIKHVSNQIKDIYVASNTDYPSDWHDNLYSYKLYLVYSAIYIPSTLPLTKSSLPGLPEWDANIENNMIDKYSNIRVEEAGTPPAGNLYIFARAKAKLTIKSTGDALWTKEYFYKSWQVPLHEIHPYPRTDVYRVLKLLGRPTLTITEGYIGGGNPRYTYLIQIQAPVGEVWVSEPWEWRLVYTTSQTTEPELELDTDNSLILSKTSSLYLVINGNNNRLTYLKAVADIILDRTLDSYDSPNARITAQTYKLWQRP